MTELAQPPDAGEYEPVQPRSAAATQSQTQQPKPPKAAAAIVAITVAAIIGLSLWFVVQPQPLLIQGEADATRDRHRGARRRARGKSARRPRQTMSPPGSRWSRSTTRNLSPIERGRGRQRGGGSGSRADSGRNAQGGHRGAKAAARLRAGRQPDPRAAILMTAPALLSADEFASVQKLDEATALARCGADAARIRPGSPSTRRRRHTPSKNAAWREPRSSRRKPRSTTLQAQVARIDRQGADRVAGLPDRRRTGRICFAGRAAAVAGRSQRCLAAFRLARGSRRSGSRSATEFEVRIPALGDKPVKVAGADHRDARRICGMARDAGHRRFRSADLRGSRLSGRPHPGTAARHERLCRLDGGAVMTRRRAPAFSRSPRGRFRWIWRDQAALFLAIGVPLIAFALLAATFSNAVIRGLHVSVVDPDRSQTSMTFVQAIELGARRQRAPRYFDLTARCTPSARARRSQRSTSLQHLERDIFGGQGGRKSSFSTTSSFSPPAISPPAPFSRRSRPLRRLCLGGAVGADRL